MFDPKRASRVDLKRKKFREDDKSIKRNLRTLKDELYLEDELARLEETDSN